MTTEIIENCSSCYYWQGNPETLNKQGICLHSPPIPVFMAVNKQPPQIATMFPTTANTMFCHRWDNKNINLE